MRCMTLWAGGMFYRLNGDLPKVVVLLITWNEILTSKLSFKMYLLVLWFKKWTLSVFNVFWGKHRRDNSRWGVFASGYFYPVQIFNKTPGFVFWSKSMHRECTFLKHEACESELYQCVWITYGSLWSLLHFAIVRLKSSSAKVLALDKCD